MGGLAAFALNPSVARAQGTQPANDGALSDEEQRWAAEDEPSQLEPDKEKEPGEPGEPRPVKIPVDFLLSLRSAYGISGGALEGESELNRVVAGQVQLQVDLGMLFKSGVYFGVYGHYGFGVLGSALAEACDNAERMFPEADVGCSAYALRFGIALEYHVGAKAKQRKPVDPWLGMGLGYERVQWSVSAQDAVSAAT